MKVHVFSLQGEQGKQIELPSIFKEEYRPDLINRAHLSLLSKTYQAKSTYKWAGLETSAAFVGRRRAFRSGQAVGSARLPTLKPGGGGRGEVRKVPQARSGRRAHPPKVEKKLAEKINKKERRKAIRSAIAATAVKHMVEKRGHKIKGLEEVPIIVTDSINALKKTKDVKEVLQKLKLSDELKRGKRKTIRAGRGKSRGRKYRRKKSVLIAVKEDKGIVNATKNMAGIDCVLVKNLNVELLAPGGDAGRLTVYTESAVKELEKLFR